MKHIRLVDIAISHALMQINIGGKFTKKVDAINTNLRKVEDIVYDLSMVRLGGKSKKQGERRGPKGCAKEEED